MAVTTKGSVADGGTQGKLTMLSVSYLVEGLKFLVPSSNYGQDLILGFEFRGYVLWLLIKYTAHLVIGARSDFLEMTQIAVEFSKSSTIKIISRSLLGLVSVVTYLRFCVGVA